MKKTLLILALCGFGLSSLSAFALEDGEMAVIISEDTGLAPEEVQMVLESFKYQIISTLQDDGEIKLNGVGKFFLQQAKENTRKDHRTGEIIYISAKNYLRFRASSEANDNFNPLPNQTTANATTGRKTTMNLAAETENIATKKLISASELIIEIPAE